MSDILWLVFPEVLISLQDVFQCQLTDSSCSSSRILTRRYQHFVVSFIMKFGLSRSSAFACDLHWCRQRSILETRKQSSATQHFNSRFIWLRKCSLIYLVFFLFNAWAWQKGDSLGIDFQILHCVSAVHCHVLFRDSWQQTSQRYEVKELHFFFHRTLEFIPFHV